MTDNNYMLITHQDGSIQMHDRVAFNSENGLTDGLFNGMQTSKGLSKRGLLS